MRSIQALIPALAMLVVLTVFAEAGELETATFAGGCFWCTEASFEKLEGVTAVISGYTGGTEKDPTYRQVASGKTSHLESVQVTFDPEVIGYRELLDGFWRMFDPTDGGGSFVDRGYQYTSAIFYHDEEQKTLADASRDALGASGRFEDPIVTPIRAADKFYPAEEYHQDFYKTNPARYYSYRSGSGRDTFIEKHWADDEEGDMKGVQETKYSRPSDAELREKLTPLQYEVTQEEGTERPFRNTYWDNKDAGIYVDIVSGEPLFSSTDKFKSGTGWPSFTRPLVPENVAEKTDYKMILPRTELRSKHADSHLGHVFEDGPEPTGLRYCINSASLRFVPKESLEAEGYDEYVKLFK